MAEEKTETTDSPNGEPDGQEEPETVVVEDTDDADALKEKLDKVQGLNKQLFGRAKKAEGFTQDDDGKWVKKPVEVKEPEKPRDTSTPSGLTEEQVGKLLGEQLEKRDVEGFDISDSLKQEVSNYAKLNKVSVKKALDSEYIQFKLEKEQGQAKTEEASLGGGTKATAKIDPGKIDTSTIDHKSEQGEKDMKAWEENVRKELG